MISKQTHIRRDSRVKIPPQVSLIIIINNCKNLSGIYENVTITLTERGPVDLPAGYETDVLSHVSAFPNAPVIAAGIKIHNTRLCEDAASARQSTYCVFFLHRLQRITDENIPYHPSVTLASCSAVSGTISADRLQELFQRSLWKWDMMCPYTFIDINSARTSLRWDSMLVASLWNRGMQHKCVRVSVPAWVCMLGSVYS